MNPTEIWLEKRLGMITASELSQIMSAKGGIIETNLSYIRSKRWERKHGFAHNVTARPMEIGNEQEPYIFQWCQRNLFDYGLIDDIVYSKNLPEIPFWVSPDCPMGASPDAFTEDESIVLEFKTLVGATSIEFFGDEYTSYEEKKAAVFKDHGDQIMGLFLSNPKAKEVWLVKYIYQDDDIMKDTDAFDAPWRGLVFKFARKDYELSIEAMRNRIVLFDAMIDAPINPSEFKSGKWSIKNGVLCNE